MAELISAYVSFTLPSREPSDRNDKHSSIQHRATFCSWTSISERAVPPYPAAHTTEGPHREDTILRASQLPHKKWPVTCISRFELLQ